MDSVSVYLLMTNEAITTKRNQNFKQTKLHMNFGDKKSIT